MDIAEGKKSKIKWQIQWNGSVVASITSCILANTTDRTTAATFSSPTWTLGRAVLLSGVDRPPERDKTTTRPLALRVRT
jgi:hypothetical protein